MSAFIVGKEHIDALVSAGVQLGLITAVDATQTGVLLWQENHHSVNHRYGEHTRPPDYHADLTTDALHPIAVLRVLACYEYQSCEHPGWPRGDAYRWCQRLRRAALARLPEELTATVLLGPGHPVPGYRTSPIWEATPWDVESLTDVPRADHDGTVPTAPRAGFPADILLGPHHAPGNGISARARHVTIVTIDTNRVTNHHGWDGRPDDTDGSDLLAFARISTPSPDAPAVALRFEHGRFVARPAAPPPGSPYMASGAFVHIGDDRWWHIVGHRLPIPLHDRSETTPSD
ncbi:MAG TPA: hypothetical protein VF892_17690 [Pseudonocardiaceae bacterium]